MVEIKWLMKHSFYKSLKAIFLGFLIALIHSWAFALELEIDNDFKEQKLSKNIDYLHDRETAYSPEQALTKTKWKQYQQQHIRLRQHEGAHWLKFQLNNSSKLDRQIIIEIANPYLDRIDFYSISKGTATVHKIMGDQFPASTRPLVHPRYLFPLSLKSGQLQEILVRVTSEAALQIPITVWDRQAFIGYDYRYSVFLSIFFGVLLMFGIYHLLLALLIKDITVIYYSLFIFSVAMLFALNQGLPAVFFWPETPALNHVAHILSYSIAGASICLFTAKILLLSEQLPRVNQLFIAAAVVALAPSIALITSPYSEILRFSFAYSIFVILIYGAVLVKRIHDKYMPAMHLITASVFAILGSTLGLLAVYGYIPSNLFTQTGIYCGIMMMALFYSLSISYRINLDRQLREEAQRKLTHELDSLVRERTEELETVNQQLHIVSITDGLTQLYNRRHFDKTLCTEFNRAYREGTHISLLLMDIDHFKSLNDNFGHAFGDLCIQAASTTIKNSIHRPLDMAARYGGEEFVVLLPETELEGAYQIAHTINQEIAKLTIKDAEQSSEMTVSIGVAGEIPNEKDQQELLLKRADEFLYQAKHNGRNCVMGDPISSTPPEK
ncbi:MAG: sensor domain-containing diguanylate cyclase [Pseudomonadales bacterium]|nr:sensor domain-containing diguanylate cyclase [Pseudomonadales bacterium]